MMSRCWQLLGWLARWLGATSCAKSRRHGGGRGPDTLPKRGFGSWRRFDRPTTAAPPPPRPQGAMTKDQKGDLRPIDPDGWIPLAGPGYTPRPRGFGRQCGGMGDGWLFRP
jgi:hypothetical protein